MSSFLQELAQRIYSDQAGNLENTTVVFPNRRAGLYFSEALRQLLDKPTWSPQVLSFQDFVAQYSKNNVADNLLLVHELHQVYNEVMFPKKKDHEPFDKFYFWGMMLLKDFDDVDKYLVNAENLYKNLSRQKQLDISFDFLTEEQKEIIMKFWNAFQERDSASRQEFSKTWNSLYSIYMRFNERLNESGLAYEGANYRKLAEAPDEVKWQTGPMYFAGFNALNLAEDKIISWFIENQKATIIWDLDSYYMDKSQEAGHFLRLYRKRNVFAASFPKEYPQHIEQPKKLCLNGIPYHVGQAKTMGQELGKLLRDNPGQDLTKVAIVLADESMLFPVLHGLPPQVQAINVTMGFPLSHAPLNSLIEHVLMLQRMYNKKRGKFNFKPVLSILRHPMVYRLDTSGITKCITTIEKQNLIYLGKEDLPDIPLVRIMMNPEPENLLEFIKSILMELEQHVSNLDHAFIQHYYKLINRYSDLLSGTDEEITVDNFGRLFRQLVRSERLPFSGEPLKGLQIMGVLETRNLDFEHVFVLGMNEDFFPSKIGKHSFIPFNLRKAYELPNFDQQDAIYAYLFYRLLQRPKSVNFYYNTEGNDLGGEEMSRFLLQLQYELNMDVEHRILSNVSMARQMPPILIDKRKNDVLNRLHRYLDTSDSTKKLSPSAINIYLNCKLQFYFRYIAELYEKDELYEDIDARSLGNVVHQALELLYKPKEGQLLDEAFYEELSKQKKEQFIIQGFRQQYGIEGDQEFFFEGQNRIAKEIVWSYFEGILELDKRYAPFEVVSSELEYEARLRTTAGNVKLGGAIDRVDRKGDRIRLIDYKTGKDSAKFKNLEKLFDHTEKNREKAAFQTLFYALLYENKKRPDEQLTPTVISKDALFQNGETTLHDDKHLVNDAAKLLPQFKEHLTFLLEELFNPEVPFDQTTDENRCKFCAYKNMCGR